MTALEKLRLKTSELKAFNSDTVLALMVLIRESLETLEVQDPFAHLNFYCNWCVHSELSQRPICYKILKEITEVIISNPIQDRSLPNYNDAIVEILSLKRLRHQMLALFRQHNIPTVLFENFENWQMFSVFLREIISHKMIKFPGEPKELKGQAKKYFEQIEAISKSNNGLTATALWISTDLCSETSKWSSHWNVTIFLKNVTIRGPFVPNEHKF